MKRKIFSVLIALVLVLSFSLVTAMPAAAQSTVTLASTGVGISEWSTQKYSGNSSVKLFIPNGGVTADSAAVILPYGQPLASIPTKDVDGTYEVVDETKFYFWLMTHAETLPPPPYIVLDLDTDADGEREYALVPVGSMLTEGVAYDPGGILDTWQQVSPAPDDGKIGGACGWMAVDISTGQPVEAPGTDSYYEPLGYWKTNLPGTVLNVKIWYGEWSTVRTQDETAYVDDITIDTTTYPLELPAARPLTVDDDRVENPDAYFQTIQGAIDCAAAGETIQVYAGEYNEQVYINKANLTVESVAGKATTIIDGAGVTDANLIPGHSALVWLQKDGITFKGFTVQNYPVGWGNGGVVFLQGWNGTTVDDITGCTITANTITVSTANANGIVVSGGADSNTISTNTITVSESGGDGIIISGTAGNDTTGNQVTGNIITSMKYGVSICTDLWDNQRNFPGTVISGNTISGGTHGIGILYATGTSGSHIVIQENTISGVTGEPGDIEGIEVYYGGYVDMFRNIVQNNTTGIQVKFSADVVANYNSITGNTNGFQAADNTVDVDATKNWWNDVAGPKTDIAVNLTNRNPYEANTNGDDVSDNVDYIPWMIHTTLVANEWNIYSTPIALDSSCDTLAEALAIWGSSHVDDAFYFDSSASPQVWAIPTSLTPLQAIYLHTTEADTIDVWFSSSYTAPPQRVMYTGWNLVGPAELYNRLVDASLSDALYGTGVAAELWGYSKAISPGIHQTYWTYLREGETAGLDFVPTAGYWVYMVNQGTLGGFTYTPITMLP